MYDLIYVASPCKGDIKANLKNAAKYSEHVSYDGIPICPHLYFSTFLDDNYPGDRRKGMWMGQDLLKRCSEMRVFTDEVTEGIIAEIKIAKENDIPIKFFDSEMHLIEYDALIINDRIGPGYKKIIEDYYNPKCNECPEDCPVRRKRI